MSHISALKLHNFRCYSAAALEELSSGLIVLYGPNGAGKTNVLEAVSLLSPGRGLRGARPLEIQIQKIVTSPLGGEVGAKRWERGLLRDELFLRRAPLSPTLPPKGGGGTPNTPRGRR
jgi:hypothetical protein